MQYMENNNKKQLKINNLILNSYNFLKCFCPDKIEFYFILLNFIKLLLLYLQPNLREEAFCSIFYSDDGKIFVKKKSEDFVGIFSAVT